jgi:hypothetical protein
MDFTGIGTQQGNYHNRYPSNPAVWDEFLMYFEEAVIALASRGIEVISHSPISRLNELIKYKPFGGEDA